MDRRAEGALLVGRGSNVKHGQLVTYGRTVVYCAAAAG